MGAAEAGLATFLSNCVACLYFFVLLYKKRENTSVCIKPSMFRFRKDIFGGICAVGIPASIQNLLNVTGMTVLNNFTASFGADAVAAMGIAQKINMALIFAILRKVVLEIPILLLLNRLFPLYGLAYAQPAVEIILAAAAVIELRKIFRGSRKML